MKPILLSIGLLLCAYALFAQTNYASLTGLVLDPTGSAVPKAKITVRNTATKFERAIVTGEDGNYFLPNIPAGAYEVEAQSQGFNRAVGNVKLETGKNERLDFHLAVGNVETSVQVEAVAPQLSPGDAIVSTLISNRIITDVPQYLRSWDDLALLVPGVQGYRYTEQTGSTSAGKQGRFSVHGVRSMLNNWVLDGGDNNAISTNTIEDAQQVTRPSLDAVQEFRVVTNPYNAEYGRSPGSTVLVTTKGGSNDVHGSAYSYVRNRVFDANDFFSNRAGFPTAKNNNNLFGGTIGGPIIKNKLFWYFDYEGTRIRRGITRQRIAPRPNERIGDFSPAAAAALGVTYPAIRDPRTNTPLPDNSVPASLIDKSAAKIMALFPQPNLTVQGIAYFFRQPSIEDDVDRYSGRLDYAASSKDNLFLRYTFTPRLRFIPGFFGGLADGTDTGGWGRRQLEGQGAILGYTRIITPRLVNDFRVNFSRDYNYVKQEPFGQGVASDYVPGIPSDPVVSGGLPNVSINGITAIGSANFAPNIQIINQFQFANTTSWTAGKHTLKFGADVRAPLRNIWLDDPATRGQVVFTNSFSGYQWSDFLLGLVSQAQLSNVYVVDQRLYMYSFFVQDDWKLSPKVTVNLGLRYDFASGPWDGRYRSSNFNPAGSGSIYSAASGSLEQRTLYRPDRNNFGPRVGVAWQIDPKTVVRSGYGTFYGLFLQHGSEDQLALNPPSFINNTVTATTAPVFQLQTGFPSNWLDPSNIDLSRIRFRAANPDNRNTLVHQWSFGVQRQLPFGLFLETNYVGTRSNHVRLGYNLNQRVNGVRRYPNFGQVTWYENVANASYHGLEATLERRFRNGLTFRGAYTWSHGTDDAGGESLTSNNSGGPQVFTDRAAIRGDQDLDIRHRFVGAYSYELPFGKGKPLASHGPLAWILGGFQLSGSVTAHTGRPFTVLAGSGNVFLEGTSYADATGLAITYPRSVDCWFYSSTSRACQALAPGGTDAFARPPNTRPGNAGRNALRGPGLISTDFALQRQFPVTERVSTLFRWEVFNATNRAQFGNPAADITGSGVGSISTLTADPRIMQLSLRLKF